MRRARFTMDSNDAVLRAAQKGVAMATTEESSLAFDDAFEEAVEEGVLEAYRAEGYVKTLDDGEEVLDKTALHEAVYQVVREAKVKTPKERSEIALTRGALTKRVFPSAPGAREEWDELDAVQQAVWEQLVKDAWNPTNPNFSGPIQRMVGARDEKVLLIRTKTTVDGTPGMDCVYVTASEELIFEDFVAPLKNSVRKAAERLAKNAAMVSRRNKQLAERASREVDSGMKAAAGLAKSTLELMSGTSES
jgi:hypothetical protein